MNKKIFSIFCIIAIILSIGAIILNFYDLYKELTTDNNILWIIISILLIFWLAFNIVAMLDILDKIKKLK